MPTETSHLHQKLILNGHIVRGFADVERPVEIPIVQNITHKYGKDGALLATRTNMQGGEILIHLLPTSVSVKFFLRQIRLLFNGSTINWKGSYTDSRLGTSITMKGGYLLEAPPGAEPEGNFDIKFVFEQILPAYDGAKFGAPPLVVS